MQTLINIAFGAVLAGASLGPTAWAEAAQVNSRLLHTASVLAGVEEAGSPLDHAVAKAREALPDLPQGAH
jgi:parvulin-like peptidyl-prolyl isomerase